LAVAFYAVKEVVVKANNCGINYYTVIVLDLKYGTKTTHILILKPVNYCTMTTLLWYCDHSNMMLSPF